MSKECLTNQEVANKLGTQYTSLYHNEYSTVESCTEMGADQVKLANAGYPTIYECPADDDIIITAKYDYYCTPDHNLSDFKFYDDGNWRENLQLNPPAWLCDMDRTETFGDTNSYLAANDTLLGPGDLILVKFNPKTEDNTCTGLLGIQDIDDGTIGFLYYESGVVMADDVVWDSSKQLYTNNEKYLYSSTMAPTWVAIWRKVSDASVYFECFYEERLVNDLIDDITTNYQNKGTLWVDNSNYAGTGTAINENYLNIGMPYWNNVMFSPDQFTEIYWADPYVPRQVDLAIEGFYLKLGVM